MSFTYSAFLSYRHTTHSKGGKYVDQIATELQAELEFRVAEQVYRDKDRMRGAEFYNDALATALCQSVCMVVLFWPTYFSLQHKFCSREFKAMEELEAQRLALLQDPAERQKGLIILIALREFENIPEQIRKVRLCKNFEAYTLAGNMQRNRGFQDDMRDISSYIASRCRAVRSIPASAWSNCAKFKLPEEQTIEPWISEVAPLGIPFANRERQ